MISSRERTPDYHSYSLIFLYDKKTVTNVMLIIIEQLLHRHNRNQPIKDLQNVSLLFRVTYMKKPHHCAKLSVTNLTHTLESLNATVSGAAKPLRCRTIEFASETFLPLPTLR